jgi:5,5'-dehydrodivanillate O-demethylase oxygenase subunit
MDGVRDIGHAVLPCSWLQIMENAVDPHHVEWLHGRYFQFLGETTGFEAPAAFQKHHVKSRSTSSTTASSSGACSRASPRTATTGRSGTRWCSPTRCGWAATGCSRCRSACRSTTRHTWKLFYTVHAPEGIDLPAQDTIVDYEFPWQDEHGRHIVDYIEGQDIMAWVTQGAITDRTAEHLGTSDIGVTMLRRMFRENMAAVEEGMTRSR